MPAGMALKSDGFASSLSEPNGTGTLAAYCAARDIAYHDTDIPVSSGHLQSPMHRTSSSDSSPIWKTARLSRWTGRAMASGSLWTTARCAGRAPRRRRRNYPFRADAQGIRGIYRPTWFRTVRRIRSVGLRRTCRDRDRWRRVGGGHRHAAARGRRDHVADRPPGKLRFSAPPSPATAVGGSAYAIHPRGSDPGGGRGCARTCRICSGSCPATPGSPIIRRHLGPKSVWAMKARLEAGVAISLGERIEQATEADGRVRLVLRNAQGGRREVVTDHVIAATGYVPDVSRLGFLSEDLRASIRTHATMPVLSGKLRKFRTRTLFRGPSGGEQLRPVDALHGRRGVRRTGRRPSPCPSGWPDGRGPGHGASMTSPSITLSPEGVRLELLRAGDASEVLFIVPGIEGDPTELDALGAAFAGPQEVYALALSAERRPNRPVATAWRRWRGSGRGRPAAPAVRALPPGRVLVRRAGGARDGAAAAGRLGRPSRRCS